MSISSAHHVAEGSRRKQQLLAPIAAMTFGAIALLCLLALFLISWFDASALERERAMVQQGFQRQIRQSEADVVPMADWDKAVTRLDHGFDPKFADSEFGAQLYTFNGVTRTFVVKGDDVAVYASVNGERSGTAAFAPFADTTRQLLVPVRRAEARRPPIRPNRINMQPVTRPIQAEGVMLDGDRGYIVVATLIQPDLGLVLPEGPRAPVVITATPIDRAMLRAFASGYLVDKLALVAAWQNARRGQVATPAFIPLHAPDGTEVADLVWTPREPGRILFSKLKIPLLLGLLALGWIGGIILRRNEAVVDELIASEGRALHLAYHDPLTRLPNRACLFEQLPRLLASIDGGDGVLALLCIDLDHFKEINDRLGHQAGDELIAAVAGRLRDLATGERNGFAARLGGDEFVLLGSLPDRTAAEALAERCMACLVQPVESTHGRLDFGCSIGVTVIAEASTDPFTALHRADVALYRSKALGRNCITCFDPAMDEGLARRRAWEAHLRSALNDQSFHMVYQPQVDEDGRLRAVEALLRWVHPELGPVPPSEFIALAEESGLIVGVGEFVLRRVFEETRDWSGIKVAVNISAIQMRTPGFAARVVQFVAHYGIDPARYEIELTETALLRNEPAAEQNFAILKRLGFSMILDDFGTGYSSLSLLRRFEVDKIKIDRSFVADLGAAPEADALVNAILNLAHAFRLGVIAEGVETPEQFHRLAAAGCREFQGFLFGRPIPADAMARRVQVPSDHGHRFPLAEEEPDLPARKIG